MYSNFYLAFSVVCPLFLMMLLGYFLKIIKVFKEEILIQLNAICFKVFLPTILFYNIYQTDVKSIINPKLILIAIISILTCYVFLMILVPIFEKKKNRRGVLVQGIFRSNFILFGIPITVSLFGPQNSGVTAVIIAFLVPAFNILSVIALETFQEGDTDIGRIVKGTMKNQLILSAIFGFFFVLTGIKLPFVVEKTISDVAGVATPLAIIVLGGSFQFTRLMPNIRPLMVTVICKLLVVPVIFLPISIFLGIRGVELGSLLALFCSPTAISSFSMAQQMDADSEFAGQVVVLTSILSVLSVFFWIVVLKGGGYL